MLQEVKTKLESITKEVETIVPMGQVSENDHGFEPELYLCDALKQAIINKWLDEISIKIREFRPKAPDFYFDFWEQLEDNVITKLLCIPFFIYRKIKFKCQEKIMIKEAVGVLEEEIAKSIARLESDNLFFLTSAQEYLANQVHVFRKRTLSLQADFALATFEAREKAKKMMEELEQEKRDLSDSVNAMSAVHRSEIFSSIDDRLTELRQIVDTIDPDESKIVAQFSEIAEHVETLNLHVSRFDNLKKRCMKLEKILKNLEKYQIDIGQVKATREMVLIDVQVELSQLKAEVVKTQEALSSLQLSLPASNQRLIA